MFNFADAFIRGMETGDKLNREKYEADRAEQMYADNLLQRSIENARAEKQMRMAADHNRFIEEQALRQGNLAMDQFLETREQNELNEQNRQRDDDRAVAASLEATRREYMSKQQLDALIAELGVGQGYRKALQKAGDIEAGFKGIYGEKAAASLFGNDDEMFFRMTDDFKSMLATQRQVQAAHAMKKAEQYRMVKFDPEKRRPEFRTVKGDEVSGLLEQGWEEVNTQTIGHFAREHAASYDDNTSASLVAEAKNATVNMDYNLNKLFYGDRRRLSAKEMEEENRSSDGGAMYNDKMVEAARLADEAGVPLEKDKMVDWHINQLAKTAAKMSLAGVGDAKTRSSAVQGIAEEVSGAIDNFINLNASKLSDAQLKKLQGIRQKVNTPAELARSKDQFEYLRMIKNVAGRAGATVAGKKSAEED